MSRKVEQILKEVEVSALFLDQLDHRGKKRSYAFPCNVTAINGTEYANKLKELGLVSYARDGGDSKSIIKDTRNVNPLKVASWHVMANTKAADLIAFAEEVRRSNGMGIFQFHDIGGQLFSISKSSHMQLLEYLKKHESYFEVMTFSDAMELISAK
jgi:peptidoglycan-N-acetylglucosamine deacetylase